MIYPINLSMLLEKYIVYLCLLYRLFTFKLNFLKPNKSVLKVHKEGAIISRASLGKGSSLWVSAYLENMFENSITALQLLAPNHYPQN